MTKLDRFMTIPNSLSLMRLGLLPFILLFLSFAEPVYARLAAFLMIVAFATDALDGYFARRLNQVSLFGKIVDPVTDKAYAISIAVFLIIFRDFPLQIAAIILLRDFLILVFAGFLFRSEYEFPTSNWLGKVTGCVYGATAIAYTIRLPAGIWFAWACFILAFVSGANYLAYFYTKVEKQRIDKD